MEERKTKNYREINSELIQRYRETKSQEILCELVQNNLGLVKMCANSYWNKYFKENPSAAIDREDLFQQGILGFYNAIDKYDDEKGALGTYVIYSINNSIKRYIEQNLHVIHIPAYKYREYEKQKIKENVKYMNGESSQGLAEYKDIQLIENVLSLEYEYGKNLNENAPSAPSSLQDALADPFAERRFEDAINFGLILDAIQPELSEKEKRILVLKYRYRFTNREIAERMGFSETYVQARLSKILSRLQRKENLSLFMKG